MRKRFKRWLGDLAYTVWGLILLAYAFARFIWGDDEE